LAGNRSNRAAQVGFLFDRQNDWLSEHVKSVKETQEYQGKFEFAFSYTWQELAGFEIIFILGYTRILPSSFLESSQYNLVVHESALPLGKGFSPVQRQIVAGRNHIPVCLIEAVAEVDAGDILGRTEMRLSGYELFEEIRLKQAEATIELVHRFLDSYPTVHREKQTGPSSFYERRTEADDELDADQSIRDQFNHFRIADNHRFPLHFSIDGHRYYLNVSKA
jgi:methionyl-tRNA formyltransferase